MCNVYNAMAGLRYPNYKITGSGPLAVVCDSQQEIYLHELPMAANLAAAQSCWCCDSLFKRKNMRHKSSTFLQRRGVRISAAIPAYKKQCFLREQTAAHVLA
jgi:hypothetical protein